MISKFITLGNSRISLLHWEIPGFHCSPSCNQLTRFYCISIQQRAAKYDEELASQALIWMKKELTKANSEYATAINTSATDADSVQELLKDGVILVA